MRPQPETEPPSPHLTPTLCSAPRQYYSIRPLWSLHQSARPFKAIVLYAAIIWRHSPAVAWAPISGTPHHSSIVICCGTAKYHSLPSLPPPAFQLSKPSSESRTAIVGERPSIFNQVWACGSQHICRYGATAIPQQAASDSGTLNFICGHRNNCHNHPFAYTYPIRWKKVLCHLNGNYAWVFIFQHAFCVKNGTYK